MRTVLVAAALILAGCPGFGDKTLAELEGIDGVPTWHADVQPIIASYCQTCHRDPPIAGAPYALLTLEQVRSHADRIRVRSVQIGDMPPGGGLPDAEKATLEAWISGGMPEGRPVADAGRPDATVVDAAPLDAAPLDAAPPEDAVVDGAPVDAAPPPTWDTEIGPLFVRATCTEGGCHDSRGLSAQLSLTTYAGFLAGGVSGALDGGGDPAASLLVTRLRARGGSTLMPLGRSARPEAEIQRVEAWIAAGAPEN